MVPDWFQRSRFQIGFGSRMAPAILFFFLFFALAWWSRELLTDWFSFLWQEGRIEYGAMRLRFGERPYLDFYFSDTPGVLALHALAQWCGMPGFTFQLAAASLSAATVFRWSASWRPIERGLLGLLLVAWSFSLWNISHPIWPALSAALLGIGAGRAGRWVWAGALFGAAFWMQQQVGILVFLGAAFFLFFQRERWRLAAGFVAGIFLPLIAIRIFLPESIGPAIRQIDFLPALPLRDIPKQVIGAPLVVFGLWVLSLYFFRSTQKLRMLSFFAVLVYAGVGWMQEGRGFLLGCLFLFSLLIWIAAPLLAAREGPVTKREFLGVWMPAAGFFLLFSGEFPPFLILFPLTAYFLIWTLSRLSNIYPWIPRWWMFAPALALLVGGGLHQSRLLFLYTYASRDAIGKLTYGELRQVSEEMAAVKDFLYSMGAKEGDPLLVLPSAPYFYVFTGLRNPTPFDVVSEKSLSHFSYGPLLPEYLKSGGKFVVVQGNAPSFLSGELQEKFTPTLRLSRFSVWRKNEN